eukprot:scaffold748_cov329-Pavlova_lutheri.AAC.12
MISFQQPFEIRLGQVSEVVLSANRASFKVSRCTPQRLPMPVYVFPEDSIPPPFLGAGRIRSLPGRLGWSWSPTLAGFIFPFPLSFALVLLLSQVHGAPLCIPTILSHRTRLGFLTSATAQKALVSGSGRSAGSPSLPSLVSTRAWDGFSLVLASCATLFFFSASLAFLASLCLSLTRCRSRSAATWTFATSVGGRVLGGGTPRALDCSRSASQSVWGASRRGGGGRHAFDASTCFFASLVRASHAIASTRTSVFFLSPRRDVPFGSGMGFLLGLSGSRVGSKGDLHRVGFPFGNGGKDRGVPTGRGIGEKGVVEPAPFLSKWETKGTSKEVRSGHPLFPWVGGKGERDPGVPHTPRPTTRHDEVRPCDG